MTDSLYIVSNQIISLILSINKKNFKQTDSEINQLVKQFKSDADHHLFRVLFSSIDFSLFSEGKTSKDIYKCQLLMKEINAKISKPNFSSLLSQAIDRPLHPQKCIKQKNQLLPQISKVLKLNKVQEVVIGLSLFQSSNKETACLANQWVRQKLPDLLRSYVDDNGGKENGGFQEISMEILHLILTNLLKDKDNFGIGEDQLSAFLNTLKKDFPKVDFPVVLSVILYNEDESMLEKETKELGFNKYDKNYLADILEELGSVSAQNLDEMRATLQDFDSKYLTPSVIAKCICMFMRTSGKTTPLQVTVHRSMAGNDIICRDNEIMDWKLENFFTVIFEKNPTINKNQIIEELDCKEFDASTKSALSVLHICISHCVSAFPTNIFYTLWKNPVAQFSFLKSCISFSDIISFSSWPHKKCDLSVLKMKFEDEVLDSSISVWKNIDFVEILLKLSDNGLLLEVTEMFESSMKHTPQILICSLIQSLFINPLKNRLLLKLFTLFIPASVSISLFTNAWNINVEVRPLILSSLFEYYKESENTFKNLSCVFRIADIISEIKAVQYILPSNPNATTSNIFKANAVSFRYEAVHFALDIVIYCTKKNSDFLSQWVNELLLKESNQIQNFKVLVSYIHFRYPKLIDNEDSKFIVPRELILDAQCLYDFLKNLDSIGKMQFQSDPVIYQDMHIINIMLTKLSQMMNQNLANLNLPNNQTRQNTLVTNPKLSRNKLDPTRSAFIPQSKINRNEMEYVPEVNRVDYIQQAPVIDFKSLDPSKYKAQMMLQYGSNISQNDEKVHKQESNITIEQEILKNLKMLFEGELSLQTMCEIYLNPVKSKRESLNILIRMLIDELSYINDYPEKHGKIYADLFIQILNMDNNLISKADINKIYEFICNQNSLNTNSDGKNSVGRDIIDRILSVTNFKKSEVILNEQMTNATIGSSNTGPLTSITAVNTSIVFGNIEPPPENVTEKVLFIINNVSKLNVQEKASQLSELVTHDYVPWFSHYIVVKRVTTEANFHELFIQLIDCMSDQLTGLRDKVLLETYRNIKILLANMKSDLSDFNDRQLLKNLGKFLGMITLAKNKPILHDDMNLKDMLYEAYNKGHIELHYVVPFVTKTLEGAKDSIVFKPPCPWTMAILRVLKELHEVDSVKLNLKFEVEILCRNLKCDFTKLIPAMFLNDRNVRIETPLCRIVPLASNQPTSSGTMDTIPTDSLSVQSMSFNNRSSMHFMNESRSIHMPNTRPQNLESIDANRGSSMRSNMQYSQAMPTNISQSTALINCQNVGMRSSGQDVSQYYSMMNNTQPNFVTSQQSSQLTNQQMDHINTTIRSINIPYDDLNTNNIPGYLNVDDIPPPILNQIPNLKIQLISTMERIVFDLVSPLYDRCAKITIGTVEQLVLKDFGMDGDLKTIKQYAFGMCRNLTAGLCLVTAREIIGVHLNTAVKQTILGEYRHVNTQDKEQVDNFANKIVSSNNEICVAFLQKIVAEKAINELDKKLNSIVISDSQKRIQYKATQQELQVYESFNRNIPGFSSLPHHLQMSGNIPSWNTSVMNNLFHQKSQLATRQFAIATGENIIENPIGRMISEIERQMTIINSMARNDIFIRSLRQILDTAYLALQNSEPPLIHRLMRETVSSFMNMYHTQITKDHAPASLEIMERLKEAHMYALRIMQPYEESSGFISVNKQVTIAWTNMEDLQRHGPGKWNGEAFCELLKTHVICLPVMDAFIAKKILENNHSALFFILDLLKNFVTGDKREFTVLNEFDLSSTIDAINQVILKNQFKLPSKEAKLLNINLAKINQLMDLGCLEKTVSPIYLYNGISLSREFDDPPTMPERSEIMIRMWMEHYCSSTQRDNISIQNIITSMTQTQIIHNDETFVRFLRLASVYIVERAHKQLKQDAIIPNSNRSASYTEIDAYAMLVCCLILRSNLNKSEVSGKSCLLNKSLGIIAGTLLQEHEVRRDWFHPMPFQRILIMLFNELQNSLEEEQYDFQNHVLTAFAHTFHVIRPKCAPSFVFSWLELISHRSFISKMLTNNNWEYTHSMYIQLLCDLYSFLRPYLENLHLPRPVQMIYKGAVSLTCLLMHDFPELLINYHALLCTIIPINCIQLRNIILCTTTKKMLPLPDVLKTTHLEQLNQMEDPSGYCISAGDRIKPLSFRSKLDSYLVSRAPVKFLSELVNGLKKENECQISNISIINPKEISKLINIPEDHISRNSYYFKSTGIMHYDVELMNNVILYLCITAVKVLREKNIPLNINTIAHTAQMDIIQSLVLNLDNEGRFLLLNCMANQLRYPNSHSFYFKNTLLYLFAEQPQESVKEQITRVILERIIVNRPHPWGLLVVMNELFKNPTYKFWDHKFLHCSEEVEKIIESVVKGCRGSIPPQIEEITNAGITAES